MHLFIVDDDREFGQMLSKNLTDLGRVSVAETYQEALDKIKNEKIDILIFDYYLPDGNGLDLVRSASHHLKNSKTILISGAASKQIAIDCVNLQISAIIEKPFLGTEIREVINKLVLSKKITICELNYKIEIHGQQFSLTPVEFKIFKLLYDHSSQRMSRSQINQKVWGNVEISDNILDTNLMNIKKKMKNFSYLITNVKGHGYNLKVD